MSRARTRLPLLFRMSSTIPIKAELRNATTRGLAKARVTRNLEENYREISQYGMNTRPREASSYMTFRCSSGRFFSGQGKKKFQMATREYPITQSFGHARRRDLTQQRGYVRLYANIVSNLKDYLPL